MKPKFRAWDKENKKMVMSGDRPSFHFWKWVEYDSSTPLMQSTGLLDKNGKEIYCGDILQGIKTFTDNGIIIVDDNVFGSILQMDKQKDTSVEIIGNIYEDSNLLK